MNRTCLLIPVYDHPDTIEPLVERLQQHGIPLILVNDGSGARCTAVLRALAQRHDWLTLVERGKNGGKGAAVKTGLSKAAVQGFSHVLQLDADGQHNLGDIDHALKLSAQTPEAMVSGAPDYCGAPLLRYYGRYLTHVWVWIHTLSLDIEDSMCGFRVYPLKSTLQVLDSVNTGNRMDFDPEIMVRLYWAGVPIRQFRTLVSYPEDGISHFRGFADNALISWAHTRLFFGMLLRLPHLLQRKWMARG